MKRKRTGTYVSLWFSDEEKPLLDDLARFATLSVKKSRNGLIKDIIKGWMMPIFGKENRNQL